MTIVVGSAELIVERAIVAAHRAVRGIDPDCDISEVAATDLGADALSEIRSPSLFATMRCVIVRAVDSATPDIADALSRYAEQPADDVALVLTHAGGVKGKALLERLRKAGVAEIRADGPARNELRDWVLAEFASYRPQVRPPTAIALIDALGDDLRALAASADQLMAIADGAKITPDLVRTYFGGRAEVKGFAVADAALDGKVAEALEHLQWAFALRVPPVLVTSAFATGLRAVARYRDAPRPMREADLARTVGVPAWKLRTVGAQARGWSTRGLVAAIQATAAADADVKGAAHDANWACERLVISVIRARALR